MFYVPRPTNPPSHNRFIKILIYAIGLLVLSACGSSNNDNATNTTPTLSVSNTSSIEGDSGTTDLSFSVNLNVSSSDVITVDFATSTGTATAGTDYTAITTGTLTMSPGTLSADITVRVFGDTDFENDETVTLVLKNPTGATLGTASATGTILNDDTAPQPTLSINNASIAEGDSGTNLIRFTVNLSGPSSRNITVNYATTDALANSTTTNSDYIPDANTLTIVAGDTSATIDISIRGDTTSEGDETFTVTLSDPSGATISNAVATGTILNDDGGVTVVVASINDSSVVEGNTGSNSSLVFTVSLSSAATSPVSIAYASSNETTSTSRFSEDYSPVNGTIVIDAGLMSGSISINVIGDDNIESDETLILTLSNLSSNAMFSNGTAMLTATGTIENDDLAIINIVNTKVDEGDSGNTVITFYVNAGFETAKGPMSFNYSTQENASATAGSDYTSTNGSISFNTGERIWDTITVNITPDIDIEGDETFSLQLSNPVGVKLSTSMVTATIVDDDADISISNARITEGDSGSRDLVFTVTLDQKLPSDVSLDFATGDSTMSGTATAGVDYTATSGTLTIPANTTQANITISVFGDSDVEQNETIPIILSNVSSNAILGRSVAFGFIDNDDGGTTVALAETGQQTCFDAILNVTCSGTGQDGETQSGAAFPSPRFTVMVNTIKDNLTGLIWSAQGDIMLSRDLGYDTEGVADDGFITWQTALNYVSKLNYESYLGFNDWRLPNRAELRSLANYGVTNNATELGNAGFSGYANAFWSSSSLFSADAISASAWVVDMVSGNIFFADKTELVVSFLSVVPVRGGSNTTVAPVLQTGQVKCFNTAGSAISCTNTGQDGEYQQGVPWPASRFTVNTDTTITDNLTGLVWGSNANVMITRDQRFDLNRDGRVSWQVALDYISKLNTEKYLNASDWRLPNINELQSLINLEQQMTNFPPLINTGWLYDIGFSDIGDIYWTSDSFFAMGTSTAWTTHLGSSVSATPYAGATPAISKTAGNYYVWPVRGGS